MGSHTNTFFRSKPWTGAANVSPMRVKEDSAGYQSDARDRDSENRSFYTASPHSGLAGVVALANVLLRQVLRLYRNNSK
jgi:hypothetical protein